MIKNMKKLRLQSAMEYLMTYGWAILIIAVVLAVLFSLGIFNGGNLLGSSCVGSPGYLCQNALMTPAQGIGAGTGVVLGQATLGFGLSQSTGATEYNIGFACASTTSASGTPYNAVPGISASDSVWQWVDTSNGNSNGNSYFVDQSLTGTTPSHPLTLVTGQSVQVANILCFNPQGVLVANTLGSSFSGVVYLNYTTLNQAPGASNPWLTTKIATVSIKVS